MSTDPWTFTEDRIVPLVPPRRLGSLLSAGRVDRGLGLAEAADQLGLGWSAIDLLEVEAGRRLLSDIEVEMLAAQYGLTISELVPQRSRLIVDVRERTIALADVTIELDRSGNVRDDVLSRYLALVCSMRGVTPGATIGLRRDDLEVLASVLSSSPGEIRSDLEALLIQGDERVEDLWTRIKGRVLVPAVGVVVAATAVGTLLLVPTASGATGSQAAEEPVVTIGAGSGQAVDIEIGDAVVQERLDDGSPGPVIIRD